MERLNVSIGMRQKGQKKMPTDNKTIQSAEAGIPALAMAAAGSVAVASVYYNQPMLGLIARDYPGSGADGIVPAVTQIGYAAGLVFLVPLGDVLERRRLIVTQFLLLAMALAFTAAAATVPLLVVASALVGISATAAQQIVPFAAHLAPPQKSGAVVGKVMAGLLSGILMSRTLAGFVAGHFGWREMFWLAVPVTLFAALLMALRLPEGKPHSQLGYLDLMKSVYGFWKHFAELRWSALTQALLFAAFSTFWTVLALRLDTPAFGLGPAAAGLFGIVGLVGVLAAPLAGRLSDRGGPRRVVILGAATTLAAWIVLGAWNTIAGMIAGVILLDFGVQCALIANQQIIYALEPKARSRINTVYMGVMFTGGAIGSATATVAWRFGGWAGVSIFAILISTLATAAQLYLARAARSN